MVWRRPMRRFVGLVGLDLLPSGVAELCWSRRGLCMSLSANHAAPMDAGLSAMSWIWARGMDPVCKSSFEAHRLPEALPTRFACPAFSKRVVVLASRSRNATSMGLMRLAEPATLTRPGLSLTTLWLIRAAALVFAGHWGRCPPNPTLRVGVA